MQDALSDEALMMAYLAGDALAFEVIYERYSGNVLAYLRKKLAASEDQDEVFQLVFLKFHKSRRSYDSNYPVLQWLYVITRSTLLDYIKSAKWRDRANELFKANNEVNESEQSSVFEVNPSERLALSGLNQVQKEVVQQRIFDEASYREIAKKLRLTESNARQTFRRAIKRLKLTQSRSE